MGKVARYFVLTVSLIGIALVLYALYGLLRPRDSLGEYSSDCDSRGELPSVPNGSGMVATGHSTGCAIALLSTAFTTYVYLHRLGESDSAKSLIFRFDEGEYYGDPQITWTDTVSLHISVPGVMLVTKQVTSVGTIKISYSVAKEDMSREQDLRYRKHLAEVLFACLAFLIGICFLAVRSIGKQKNKESMTMSGECTGG